MTKRRSMPYEAPNQGGLNIRPGKPIKSGMGGEIKSGTGTTVRSRSFGGDPTISVKPYFREADIDRVDREMKEESMARKLDMPTENYREAIRAPKGGGDTLNLAKGGLVRDLGGNDHMNTSRGVDRMPAYVKHSKR